MGIISSKCSIIYEWWDGERTSLHMFGGVTRLLNAWEADFYCCLKHWIWLKLSLVFIPHYAKMEWSILAKRFNVLTIYKNKSSVEQGAW